ncbi:MAG: ABC transporter substrate-binding protein [Pseudomonadota bacterium]
MLRTALVSLAVLAVAGTATAGPEAEALIKNAASELAAGDLTPDELTEMVDSHAIASFALGRHKASIDDVAFDQFKSAFTGFLEQTFSDHAHRFEGATIRVTGSNDRSARDSIVTTQVSLPGVAPETVRWRVLNRDGEWKIVDVQVQGLWLAIEQRAQVAAVLDRENGRIDAAIEALG